MPSWSELVDEVKAAGSTHDLIRRKYLEQLHTITGRNVIVYYSAFLQKTAPRPTALPGLSVNDSDINGLMATIYNLDKPKGLDLVLHTPGGGIAATEAIVTYLRSVFGINIRAIVPQLALSAGTMIALACKEVIMGKHSSLGPIDPQVGGVPAHAIVEEFTRAKEEIVVNPANVAVWQPIIAKYNPTLISQCEKAIEMADAMVRDWLLSGMFAASDDAEEKANAILGYLAKPAASKTHDRHVSLAKAEELGLVAVPLESAMGTAQASQDFQSAVLTVHHACMLTLAQTDTSKLIENHEGIAHQSQIEGSTTTLSQV